MAVVAVEFDDVVAALVAASGVDGVEPLLALDIGIRNGRYDNSVCSVS